MSRVWIYRLIADLKNRATLALRPRARGVLQALSRRLPSDTWATVLLTTPDKRLVVAQAAAALGIEESHLVAEIAARCGLPAIATVDQIDLSQLPAEIRLPQLHRSGAIPILAHGKVVKIACVMPELVHDLEVFDKLPRVLAPWGEISRALTDSELEMTARENARAAEDEVLKTSSAVAALSEIVTVVLRYAKDSQVSISLSPQGACYEFVAHDQRRAVGEIAPGVVQSLQRYLCELAGTSLVLNGKEYRVARTGFDETSPMYVLFPEQRQIDHSTSHQLNPTQALSPAKILPFPERDQKQSAPHALAFLVEDNDSFRAVLCRYFERNGYAVRTAHNGIEALAILETLSPQPRLIVTDVHMPLMNGIELLSELQSRPAFSAIPTVVLSSDTDVELKLTALERGATHVLSKQGDPRILMAHAERLTRTVTRQEMRA